MSWKQLLAGRKVHTHQTSKQELDELRAVVKRDLADAALPALSEDRRFATAYNAALQAARMAVACAGYRVCAFMLFHLLPWVSALKSLRRLSTVVDERTRDHWTESGFIIQLLTTTYVVICCGEAMGMALYRLGMLQMFGYR